MTNETKQTAVEQLFIEMLEIQQSGKTLTFDENVELLNKYKEMEKEQIKDAFIEGANTIYAIPKTFDEWYNETYGGDK